MEARGASKGSPCLRCLGNEIGRSPAEGVFRQATAARTMPSASSSIQPRRLEELFGPASNSTLSIPEWFGARSASKWFILACRPA